jgi:hypothetical protein
MAVNIPGTLPRDVGGGQTGSQRAGGFVTVQTSGVRDLARSLLRAATAMGRDATKPLTDAGHGRLQVEHQRRHRQPEA